MGGIILSSASFWRGNQVDGLPRRHTFKALNSGFHSLKLQLAYFTQEGWNRTSRSGESRITPLPKRKGAESDFGKTRKQTFAALHFRCRNQKRGGAEMEYHHVRAQCLGFSASAKGKNTVNAPGRNS